MFFLLHRRVPTLGAKRCVLDSDPHLCPASSPHFLPTFMHLHISHLCLHSTPCGWHASPLCQNQNAFPRFLVGKIFRLWVGWCPFFCSSKFIRWSSDPWCLSVAFLGNRVIGDCNCNVLKWCHPGARWTPQSIWLMSFRKEEIHTGKMPRDVEGRDWGGGFPSWHIWGRALRRNPHPLTA